MRRDWILPAFLAAALSVAAAQTTAPAKHPFTAKDWASLRSAAVSAVSPDGSILYIVTFGAEKGPTQPVGAAPQRHAGNLRLAREI